MLIITIIVIGIAAFVGWASAARLDELARAQGQIIAAQRTQVVQSIDGGVLRALLVSEGDIVKKGQLVAVFDKTRAEAAYDDSQNKVAALQARLVRLQAEVYGRGEVVFPARLSDWPQFMENQRNLFEKRQQALDESIVALKKLRTLAMQELAMTKPLLEHGDVGQAQVVRLEKQVAELNGRIINQQNQYFQEAQTEMAKADEELAAQLELMRERKVILDNTDIFAPQDGIVRDIGITTLGATLKPGDPILEILPTDNRLIFEAKFAPSDIAPLKLGLPAQVKLDAYDYSIYGKVDGEVSYISPDALTHQDSSRGEVKYYRVYIELGSNGQIAPFNRVLNDSEITINPGMTGIAEVRTRDKTLLSYLTKPVIKTLDVAFTER
ncbi:MAG: HlyD family secretion protein [Rhodospirillales bacterium]|nr:HlyD family secretion protein [Rhodospirillales bacterium]